jgi:hypothetical protein
MVDFDFVRVVKNLRLEPVLLAEWSPVRILLYYFVVALLFSKEKKSSQKNLFSFFRLKDGKIMNQRNF